MKNKLLSGLCAGMVLAAISTSGYAYGSASDNKAAVNLDVYDVYCDSPNWSQAQDISMAFVGQGKSLYTQARHYVFSSGDWLYGNAMVGVDQCKLTSAQIKQYVSSSKDAQLGLFMGGMATWLGVWLYLMNHN